MDQKMASTIFKCPALGRLRLACVEDTPFIYELVNESMSMNFRVKDPDKLVYLIENGILSVCQLDVNETIVGFLCARDYSLIPSVHPVAWEEYVWNKYKTVELNARNTLFLHLLSWNPKYGRECVDNMLKSVFMHDAYIQHIAMVKCQLEHPLLVPGQFRSEGSFRRVQAMERGTPGDQLPALYIADRKEVCPRLRVRRAVEEDNDDIVPIIEHYSTRLRELYGEFYISELISRHPESERVLLVCESKEIAVGVMCLNTTINYDDLEESFELTPFAGLKKVEASPPYHKYSDAESIFSFASTFGPSVQESVRFRRQSAESASTVQCRDDRNEVSWLFGDDGFENLPASGREVPEVCSVDAFYDVSDSSLTDFDILEEEEDELDFDIVNIDRSLLKVPKYLSYDAFEKGPLESFLKNIQGRREYTKRETVHDTKTRKNKSKSFSANSNKVPVTKKFSGPPNAFLLELFAMHPDHDERHGFDMLEAAYELFPDRDYCILCLPSNHVSFPLLQHFTLVTPRTTRLKFVNQTLYVAHVNSVTGNIAVRTGEAFDVPPLRQILLNAPRGQVLLELFQSTFSSLILQSFVLLSQNQPIGMVVLGPLEDATAVRVQYDLEPEPVRPGTDGSVLAGVMSPILEPHGRWFMRELLRHSQYSTLFWISRLFGKGDASPSRNLMSLAGHMVPIHPRKSVPNIFDNSILKRILQDIATPFALWMIERPLSSLPKVYVNNSIVVVGASRTGLAFLETLLMGQTADYLTFSNITLVSEHGLPTTTECLKAADTCVPKDGRYNDRYIKSIPFYYYIDVVSAVVVGIDRKNKCIHLRGGGVKYYDELVLTCGQQFQYPDYLTESHLATEIQEDKPCHRILMDNIHYKPDKMPVPTVVRENVMLINSLYDANICLRRLMLAITEFKDSKNCVSENNPVIVYGECVEAYCCVAALLELGLTPNMIVFVEPFPPEDTTVLRVNCFNNETIDERVQANLESLGIRVYRRCYLASWRQEGSRVEALHFMSSLHAIRLPCFALFYYGLKAIDVNAFSAVNQCGLVYDGGLIVDQNFHTNDPVIYAAGTFTTYTRRLYASKQMHRHYCSEDVGEALAKMFLAKLDPFVSNTIDGDIGRKASCFGPSLLSLKVRNSQGSVSSRSSLGTSRIWQPVAKYQSPIMQSATLPGPLYYMKLRKPGIELPMEVQMTLPTEGHTLITDKNGNYFRLRLNKLHCIESVTCLSNKPFFSNIIEQVYGKHESFFNKLLFRFKREEIDDLYEYFVQPWMSAMYQDTFSGLLHVINDQNITTVSSLLGANYKFLKEDLPVTKERSSRPLKRSCESELPDNKSRNTFRSLIDKFVSNKSSKFNDLSQNEELRKEVMGFWKDVVADRIVMSHIASYLNKHSATNPHYAVPQREFI